VALLDRAAGLLDRPDLVVHDRVAVRGVADALEISVGAADDADDAVVGDRYSWDLGRKVAASLSSFEPDATVDSNVRGLGYNTCHPAGLFWQPEPKGQSREIQDHVASRRLRRGRVCARARRHPLATPLAAVPAGGG
jgi:hypothetical protein